MESETPENIPETVESDIERTEVQLEVVSSDNDDRHVEITLDPYGKELAAHKAIAKEIADAIKGGMDPDKAAKIHHVKISGPFADHKVRAAVEELLHYEWPAEVRKKVVRARLNKIVLTGDDKDAVAAAKVVSADPEVDIAAKTPGTAVNISFSEETLALFERVQADQAKPKDE